MIAFYDLWDIKYLNFKKKPLQIENGRNYSNFITIFWIWYMKSIILSTNKCLEPKQMPISAVLLCTLTMLSETTLASVAISSKLNYPKSTVAYVIQKWRRVAIVRICPELADPRNWETGAVQRNSAELHSTNGTNEKSVLLMLCTSYKVGLINSGWQWQLSCCEIRHGLLW